jgi:hypothetical protein
MARNTETGIAKNIANGRKLQRICSEFGTAYNPVRTALQLTSLDQLLTQCETAQTDCSDAESVFDNAQNSNEIVFKRLQPLISRVQKAFQVTDAPKQSVADINSITSKIRGARIKPIKENKSENSDEPAARHRSVSQRSMDNQIEFFANLIQALSTSGYYVVNEAVLNIAALNQQLSAMRESYAALNDASARLATTRIARNRLLNADRTGLCDIASDIKKYVASVFGSKSEEYKRVAVLKFTKRKI